MIDDPLNRTKVKRGEDLPQSKLTEDDVRNIFALANERNALRAKANELTNVKIAEKFDVSTRTIERLLAGETWGHLNGRY